MTAKCEKGKNQLVQFDKVAIDLLNDYFFVEEIERDPETYLFYYPLVVRMVGSLDEGVDEERSERRRETDFVFLLHSDLPDWRRNRNCGQVLVSKNRDRA